MRRRRTIVLSDVHLSQAHPEDPADPLWMRYRRREHHPDADYAALVDFLLASFPDDALELVWNGDVLDFDAPWVKDGRSSFDEFPLDDAGCAAQARRILSDHPGWVRATARLLLAGHRLLVVSGNHDIELYWPGVRRVIREELAAACAAEAEARGRAAPEALDLEAQVRFRTWFHVTEDGIYLEHGSQYDMLNGVPWAMLPVRRDRTWIHPVCGKLAFKRTGSRMGYFNPYYEETFYLGLSGYLAHFWSHYARSHRHIIRTWFWGSARTALEIWRGRSREDWAAEERALACAETGAPPEAVAATQALAVPKAERTMIPILRELWLDRVIWAAFVLVAAAAALAFGGALAAAYVGGTLVVLFAMYERFTPKPDIRTYDSAPPGVEALFEIHGVRAVCMGHTHRPYGVWSGGTREGGVPTHVGDRIRANSGSWCPAFEDALCTRPVLPRRPVLMLVTEPGGALHGGLYWWGEGALAPDPEGARTSAIA